MARWRQQMQTYEIEVLGGDMRLSDRRARDECLGRHEKGRDKPADPETHTMRTTCSPIALISIYHERAFIGDGAQRPFNASALGR